MALATVRNDSFLLYRQLRAGVEKLHVLRLSTAWTSRREPPMANQKKTSKQQGKHPAASDIVNVLTLRHSVTFSVS